MSQAQSPSNSSHCMSSVSTCHHPASSCCGILFLQINTIPLDSVGAAVSGQDKRVFGTSANGDSVSSLRSQDSSCITQMDELGCVGTLMSLCREYMVMSFHLSSYRLDFTMVAKVSWFGWRGHHEPATVQMCAATSILPWARLTFQIILHWRCYFRLSDVWCWNAFFFIPVHDGIGVSSSFDDLKRTRKLKSLSKEKHSNELSGSV